MTDRERAKDREQMTRQSERGDIQHQGQRYEQAGSSMQKPGQSQERTYGFSRQGMIYDEWGQPAGVYYEEWTVSGPFTGSGPEGYHRSDDRIKEDVCDRLTQHGYLDARNIQVDVKDGEVILKGTVPDRRSKRMAEDTADSVPGVADVHNELRIQRHEYEASRQ